MDEVSGGASGALNADSVRAIEHAERYYEAIRNRTSDSDVKSIAENIEWPEKVVRDVEHHVFLDEHDLGDGEIGRFGANFEIAQAWDRLIQGTPNDLDIMLMKHELVELMQMKRHGYDYGVAHEIANKYHNWALELDKLRKAGEL